MRINEVKIIPANGKSLRARATVSLENGCVLKYLRIVKRKTLYSVVFPSGKAMGKVCGRLNSMLDRKTRMVIRDYVLNAYIIQQANSLSFEGSEV